MTTYNGGGLAIGPNGDLAGFTYDSDANAWSSTCAISAVGNVTGLYINGDGSQLTNLPAGNYSNANVAAYLPTYSGDLSANDLVVTGDITAGGLGTGNITVAGNVTAANFYGNGSALTGVSNYSNANVASYMSTFSGNISGNNITAGNVITADSFVGDGSTLSNIQGANVIGTISLATFANTAGFANTATSANIANIATTAIYANTAGFANTATSANTATTAASITTTNFTITEVGGKLMFAYQGTNIASLTSVGVFTAGNNVTGYGTP